MASNISSESTESDKLTQLIEIGRHCGVSCDDVAWLVGKEQTGTISDEERDELRRLRRLEVL